jgi:addiction module HigA family antidote
MTIDRSGVEGMDFSDVAGAAPRLAPVPPGEVLREEFMAPHGLSARALARDLGVPPNRVTAILNGERAITAATALLLARRFGTSAEFWMNLQTAHDLEVARAEAARPAEAEAHQRTEATPERVVLTDPETGKVTRTASVMMTYEMPPVRTVRVNYTTETRYLPVVCYPHSTAKEDGGE